MYYKSIRGRSTETNDQGFLLEDKKCIQVCMPSMLDHHVMPNLFIIFSGDRNASIIPKQN